MPAMAQPTQPPSKPTDDSAANPSKLHTTPIMLQTTHVFRTAGVAVPPACLSIPWRPAPRCGLTTPPVTGGARAPVDCMDMLRDTSSPVGTALTAADASVEGSMVPSGSMPDVCTGTGAEPAPTEAPSSPSAACPPLLAGRTWTGPCTGPRAPLSSCTCTLTASTAVSCVGGGDDGGCPGTRAAAPACEDTVPLQLPPKVQPMQPLLGTHR